MSEFSEHESFGIHETTETDADSETNHKTLTHSYPFPDFTTRADGNENPDKPKLGYTFTLEGAFSPIGQRLIRGTGPCGTFAITTGDGEG